MHLNTKSIKNRKAVFEYFFIEKFSCGIILTGTEVKSVRSGKVNLKEGYCYARNGEVWIKNMHIAPYKEASYNNHEPMRLRKLLLNKREIKKIESKLKEKGLTLVPVEMYINKRGLAKIDIALSKGKKHFDKRNTIKDKDSKRDMDRALKGSY